MSSSPPKINAKKFKNLVRTLTIKRRMKKNNEEKKTQKKIRRKFFGALLSKCFSNTIFSLTFVDGETKKIRVRSVIYYISRNTIKLKTSLIFGPPLYYCQGPIL